MNFLQKHPLVSVFSAALVLRGIFVLFFISSPLRYFHTVPGLDMETLLRFGEWGTTGNSFFFTLHRLQVFLFWKLNGGLHPVMLHVLWQGLLGAAGAVMVADIMLKLSGKRLLALIAGILWALNPVELMYEFTTLQDSLVNFGVILSFWSFLAARKHHFSPLYALGAGAAAGVSATGRPAAIGMVFALILWNFYYLYRRKLPLKRGAAFLGGILGVWLVFSTVNYAKSNTFTCFFNPVPYAVSINTAPTVREGGTVQTVSDSPSALPALFKTGVKMALRTPWLWNIVEIPENLNIYFLKRHIPFFRIPFEFIISGAALGMFWLIFSGKWKKKEGLLLLPILFLAVFLCIREPIGRYRLLMLPWFTLLTVCLGAYYCAPRRKTPGVLLLAAVALFYFFRPAEPLRAADFTAWAMVLEKEAGKITPESMTYFTRAFMLKPESSSAISLITRAMRTENRSLAEKSAAHWMKSSGNAPLACYYAALAAFPDHRKMKGFLDLVKPEKLPPRFQFRYYLMQGDTAAKTGSPQAAAHFYKSALRIPEGTPAQRKYAENMIKKLEKEK